MTNNKKMNINHKHCIKRNVAFTLAEMIVTLIILGTLVLILIPNMSKLVPDDRGVKYKKVFYTVQQIVDDIANDYTVCPWDRGGANVLNGCYEVTGVINGVPTTTPRILEKEICERLNLAIGSNCGGVNRVVNDTSGIMWNLSGNTQLDGTFTDINNATIYVSLRAKNFPNPLATDAANGIYGITIFPSGRVQPLGVTEQNLLFSNRNR